MEEDYTLREINKIMKAIEAIMLKIGLAKKTNSSESVTAVTKVELQEQLNIDLDVLLKKENFIDILVSEHGFSQEDLEKFAELLFELITPSKSEPTNEYIAAITSIYSYLDKHGNSFSFKRYYILTELASTDKR